MSGVPTTPAAQFWILGPIEVGESRWVPIGVPVCYDGCRPRDSLTMMKLARVVLTFVVFLSTFYFVFFPFSAALLNGHQWIAPVVSLICAVAAGWFVWKRTRSALGTSSAKSRASSEPMSSISCALYGSIVMGAVGFSAGFFGPLLLSPGANQGPLLGIFITGPAGVLFGALGGIIWSALQRKGVRGDDESSD